jgi:hypothetical protein
MQVETIRILYQRTQNRWSKNQFTIKGTAKPNETDYEMPCASGVSGRRKFAFEDRSKGRKLKELRKTVGLSELTHANKMSLRSAGKTDATELQSEALETTPTRTSWI